MLNLEKFYQNTKLVHTKNEIEIFNDIYTNNYTNVKDWEELCSLFPSNIHPIILHEFQKQYKNKKGIQGGILVELVILATIAQVFNIDTYNFINNTYMYENNEYRFVLQGNMGHGQDIKETGNDLIIFDKINNKSYNCEIKEPFARVAEMDWAYDENGHLCATQRANKEKVKLYQPIADAYNKSMTVFQHIGHNFPLTSDMVKDVIEDYFKQVDYIFTYDEKTCYLLVIPNDPNVFNLIYTSKGSEIRGTNGKNLKSIFTKKYCAKILNKYLIKEENGYYYFHVIDFQEAAARQSTGSRYKLIEGFAIKSKDAIIEDGILKCKIKDFKQNSAVISPKIHLISDYDQIKHIILKGGNDIDKR